MTAINPISPILDHASKTPDALALFVDGQYYTYRQLTALTAAQAARINQLSTAPSRVAVLCAGGAEAYCGALAALWMGATYIPLATDTPLPQLRDMLTDVAPDLLLTDPSGAALWHRLDLPGKRPRHLSIELDPTGDPALAPPVAGFDTDSAVYVVFTSGTTGHPKGVPVSARQLTHALECFQRRYVIKRDDRLSQSFPLTFDLSMFDLFMAWQQGASLHVIPARQRLAPGPFIRQQQLTLWFSVPSVIAFMHRLGQLKPDNLATLRWSLFCGEALPLELARRWQDAAPDAQMDNLYGPAEATIACTAKRLYDLHCPDYEMTIGQPLDGTLLATIGEQEQWTPPEIGGELLISGPQVVDGYWAREEETQHRFTVRKHPQLGAHRWYRTGDLARLGDDGDWRFLGRVDRQLKIRGIRTETEAIEQLVQQHSGADTAAILPLYEQQLCVGVAAFVTPVPLQPEVEARRKLIRSLKPCLQGALLPIQVRYLPQLPLTRHGKIDYRQLAAVLDEREG
ncbi:amino acid adenylation domain-containing protein [Motiliproteus sediminis]|uniref:amino acid adenylation domain-containing protein n=1 Tax=Motiliproteus sediminis TaxID=1468178 RepID=UPI001AF01F5D